MNTDKNSNTINSSINERLAYVDFKLRFTGHISRLDLGETFGIAEAAASRVLTEYGIAKPENKAQKVNTIIRESFSPLISIDGETALGMLANGFNKNKLTNNTVLPFEKVGAIPNRLNISEVAMITRAIAGEYAISCNYFSEHSSNHETRTLMPLAILYDGSQWMFRAYDRTETKSDKFKNFHFARSINVIEEFQSKEKKRLGHEGLGHDKSWNLRLPLILKLHESLSEENKAQIRRDFGIPQEQDELFTSEREAFIWITKKKWYIDDRNQKQIELDNKEGLKRFYKFKLTNHEMIKKLKESLS
jgi:hypothetical protein